MSWRLNERALVLADRLADAAHELRVSVGEWDNGARTIDCGVKCPGGLQAGLQLARICLANLGEVSLLPGTIGEVAWPHIAVATDRPVEACLLSQYAGWQISVGKFFGMGSGPMRAAAAREELFAKLNYRETADHAVGVIESGKLPKEDVCEMLAEKANVALDRLTLLVAPTSSQAGNVQVVSRSVETALHKLFELGFDVTRIQSGYGVAPLPPVAADDLTGIGRTNDAILYGGRVTLWVTGDDASLAEIGPQVPASASPAAGRTFLEIYAAAGHDFYKIDPHLFSPAEIALQNLDTGNVFRYGAVDAELLRKSFGRS